MEQRAERKQGIVTSIQVVTVQCPDCGGVCENEGGSTMIEDGDRVVTCTDCRGQYIVPATAFKLRSSTRRSKLMLKDLNGND